MPAASDSSGYGAHVAAYPNAPSRTEVLTPLHPLIPQPCSSLKNQPVWKSINVQLDGMFLEITKSFIG